MDIPSLIDSAADPIPLLPDSRTALCRLFVMIYYQ
jgi:hypothetical protein